MLLHHPSNQRAIETALGTKLMDKEDHIRERTVVVIGETKLQRETAVSDILLMQVRPTRAAHRTIIQHDGPNHLGLFDAMRLPEQHDGPNHLGLCATASGLALLARTCRCSIQGTLAVLTALCECTAFPGLLLPWARC